jgi:hypothetical protein
MTHFLPAFFLPFIGFGFVMYFRLRFLLWPAVSGTRPRLCC